MDIALSASVGFAKVLVFRLPTSSVRSILGILATAHSKVHPKFQNLQLVCHSAA